MEIAKSQPRAQKKDADSLILNTSVECSKQTFINFHMSHKQTELMQLPPEETRIRVPFIAQRNKNREWSSSSIILATIVVLKQIKA